MVSIPGPIYTPQLYRQLPATHPESRVPFMRSHRSSVTGLALGLDLVTLHFRLSGLKTALKLSHAALANLRGGQRGAEFVSLLYSLLLSQGHTAWEHSGISIWLIYYPPTPK